MSFPQFVAANAAQAPPFVRLSRLFATKGAAQAHPFASSFRLFATKSAAQVLLSELTSQHSTA